MNDNEINYAQLLRKLKNVISRLANNTYTMGEDKMSDVASLANFAYYSIGHPQIISSLLATDEYLIDFDQPEYSDPYTELKAVDAGISQLMVENDDGGHPGGK